MPLIGHDFKLKYFTPKLGHHLMNDLVQPSIHKVDQHLASILRAKYDVVFARVDNVVIALELPVVFHSDHYTASRYLTQALRLISP